MAVSLIPTIVPKRLGDFGAGSFSALLYGDAGSGKTWTVRSLASRLKRLADSGEADWSRLILIDGDRGSKSISDLGDIRVITPFVDGTLGQVLNYVSGEAKAGNVDVVVIDGLDFIMREAFRLLEDAENLKPKPDMRSVWGDYNTSMWNWLTKMIKIQGPATVFITHPKEIASEDRGMDDAQYTPATIGGNAVTPESLMGMFDYVFYVRSGHPLDANNRPITAGPKQPVFVTSRDRSKGGDPRYAVKARVCKGRTLLPAVMPADLASVWATDEANSKRTSQRASPK